MRNAFVPVVGDGPAFEDGGEEADEKVEGDDAFGDDEEGAKPADHAEYAVVEQDEGGFETDRGAEVAYLYGQEYLFRAIKIRIMGSFVVLGNASRGSGRCFLGVLTFWNFTSVAASTGPPALTV